MRRAGCSTTLHCDASAELIPAHIQLIEDSSSFPFRTKVKVLLITGNVIYEADYNLTFKSLAKHKLMSLVQRAYELLLLPSSLLLSAGALAALLFRL